MKVPLWQCLQCNYVRSLEATQALYLADSEWAPRGWVVGDVFRAESNIHKVVEAPGAEGRAPARGAVIGGSRGGASDDAGVVANLKKHASSFQRFMASSLRAFMHKRVIILTSE